MSKRTSPVALYAGCTLVAGGALVCIGWELRIGILKGEAYGTFVSPNAALLFILVGASCLLQLSSRRALVRAGQAIGAIILIGAAALIAEHMLGLDLRIDRRFLAHRLNDWSAPTPPGRTSLPAVLAFFFAGIGLLGIRTPRGKRAADICAAIISSISYLAFIGYAYSLPKLYGELMALHTAVLLAVVAAALCTSRPDSIVTSKNAGGVVFRRVIAPLLVLMPLLGFVSIRAQQVLGLKVEMGTALLVVLAVFLFAGITAHTAGVVNGLDLRRRRAEDSLIRAEKLAAAGRLSATIAHEINNPLECVMNLLYLARTSDSGTTNADYIRTAEDELRRAAEIAKRTLGFYRDDSEPVDIRLGVVAREVLDLFRPRITAAGIRVETDLQATGSVSVRPGEIRQIISNLLGNAIDAVELRNEPTITIVTREGSDAVQLAVRDNGCGIPSSLLQQVFEPFFTTKKDVGTGLGLYLSRELANKNGGSLRLQSSTETDNRGTIAYLTLPISSAKGQSIPGPERVRAHVQGENT